MAKVTKELIEEIRRLRNNEPELYQKLQNKAQWEGCSLSKVMIEWGHPKHWK